ncbi:hypothetical protein B0J11DRAFT_234480 [Dendryphion nanum]|uniref:Uncharacterized protein n=1 Tax=Dendryphion nanum TaxID=256645 RepID=A0A9P9CY94_9PLEO|nr:hypothetical protein B0J11DRAFT_234480 [Dendryphion nanum]
MPGLVLLPTSLASSSIALGQLVVDPLNPSSTSFNTSTPAPTQSKKHSLYKDVFLQDDEGRFISSVSPHSTHSHENLLLVQSEQAEHISLQNTSKAFDTLATDKSAQQFFQQTSQTNQPLYYIAGIQKLKNPVYKRVALKDGSITEASAGPKLRLPIHPRRDSGADLDDTANDNDNASVIAVEFRKVRCHVGPADEPHVLEDIGYSWNYLWLEGDEQLSIGLGKAVEAAELRALAGIVGGEDFTDRSYDNSTDEDEGVGGF